MQRLGLWALAAAAVVCLNAQGVAPEVLQLRRMKDHMRQRIAQLPNSTCLETVTRFHRESSASRLRMLDQVRLEVVYNNGHEWFGWPGESDVREENPAKFIGGGMIANGIFGITLHSLFVSDTGVFKYQGEQQQDGRTILNYHFLLPRSMEVSIPGGSGTVGEEGSMWIDKETLDLMRLEIQVNQIPEYLPLNSLNYNITYARTRIGQSEGLLPQQSDMDMFLTSGVEDYDRFDFTHCRAFETESAIRFEDDDAAAPKSGAAAPAKQPPEVNAPALLTVTIALTTPVTDQDFVGKPVEGRIVGEVLNKGKTAIRDSARVRGRIRRLERFSDGERFVVGLEFTDVETPDGVKRFYADLLKMDKVKGIEPALQDKFTLTWPHARKLGLATEEVKEEIALPELLGVVSFFVEGKSSFVVPAGLKTVWRTRGIVRGGH
jgi:hypothetical protein